MPKESKTTLQMSADIGEIKGLMKGFDQRLSSLDDRLTEICNHQNSRLSALEKGVAGLKGRAAGIAFAISALISLIGLILGLIKLGN